MAEKFGEGILIWQFSTLLDNVMQAFFHGRPGALLPNLMLTKFFYYYCTCTLA